MIILRSDTTERLPFWIPLLLIGVAWTLVRLYNALLGPLSKYPGPVLNKFTILPYLRLTWIGNEVKDLAELHNKYGPVVRIAPRRLSFIGSGEVWRDIFGFAKANGTKCPKDPHFYGETVNKAPSLLVSNDEDHSRMRKIISHAFSDKALKEQEPLLRGWATLMKDKFAENAAQGPVDVVKMFNCTTFDVMADLCFAEPLYMLQNSAYIPWVENTFKGIKQATTFRVIRLHSELANRLVNYILPRVPAIRDKILKSWRYSTDRVDKRLTMTPDRPDFWTRILEKADGPGGLSIEEQYTNATGFMIAGTETSATALSGTIYYLSQNPQALRKVQEEVRSTFNSMDDMHLETLAKCDYLTAVLKEAIRLFPPAAAGFARRTPAEGAVIDGNWVPGHVGLMIPQAVTYRTEVNFKNAHEYHPERWLDDPEYASDRRDSFEPFSVGPRNCIGKNLAWHEMRLLLATFILHFDFELCEECKDWTKDMKVYLLWEKSPLYCKLRPVKSG